MSFRPRVAAAATARPSARCCCETDRLATVLGIGLRLGPSAAAVQTEVVFTEPHLLATINKNGKRQLDEHDIAECPICLQQMSYVASEDNPFSLLACGHAMHVHCLAQHIELGHTTCPICIQPLKGDDIEEINQHHPLFTRVEVGNGDTHFILPVQGGRARLMRVEHSNGDTVFFDGEPGFERFVRVEYLSGNKIFYEGEKNLERKVRMESINEQKTFFEGERNAERKVRVELRNGNIQYYKGRKGAERLVMMKNPNGELFFLEGEQGAERQVRRELPDGETSFYEGEQGAEHKVRTKLPNGQTQIFEGGRHAERLVRIE